MHKAEKQTGLSPLNQLLENSKLEKIAGRMFVLVNGLSMSEYIRVTNILRKKVNDTKINTRTPK